MTSDADRLALATDEGVVVLRGDGRGWRIVERALAGLRATCIAASGETLVAGTIDGAQRSGDGGRSWQPFSNGLAVRHLRALDASGPLLAGTEPAALFAADGGGWSERPEVAALRDRHGWWLPYSPEAGCVRDFARRGARCYAAVEVGGLLRSDDGGASWRLCPGSSGEPGFEEPAPGGIHADVHGVSVHPSSPDLLHAATARGLYRSHDGGERWQHLRGGCYTRAVWVDPGDPERLLLGVADSVRNKNGRVEESLDGGRSWHDASDGLETPWPAAMVERFRALAGMLVALLSNGDVVASAPDRLAWKPLAAGLPPARDAAALAR